MLQKAIEIGLKPIVVVNKVDKPNCTPDIAQDKVFDLMYNLGATEEQLDFVTIFGSAKQGWMSDDWKKPTDNVYPLLDAILENIPAPEVIEGPTQMLITSLEYSSFVGRIAVGRVHRGSIKQGQMVLLMHHTEIGDTISDIETAEAMPRIKVDEPTMSMLFTINDSPFFGKDGKYVTSRQIQDRLYKELEKDVALRVEKDETRDGAWVVYGRGVLHLSILIETMRREGYEVAIGQPQVIVKEINGQKCEPIEQLTINCPEEFSSKMIDMVTRRKGEMIAMDTQGDRQHLEFKIPSRGVIGLRTNVLTASAGEAIMAHQFLAYEPWKGDIVRRTNGSIIAKEAGTAFAYALDKLQDRGKFFIFPQDEVYCGQVVGEHAKDKDLTVNVTKSKKLTNMRSKSSDEKAALIPPKVFSLEEALEYIKADEYVEVTPHNIRMRKIVLDELERKRLKRAAGIVDDEDED